MQKKQAVIVTDYLQQSMAKTVVLMVTGSALDHSLQMACTMYLTLTELEIPIAVNHVNIGISASVNVRHVVHAIWWEWPNYSIAIAIQTTIFAIAIC